MDKDTAWLAARFRPEVLIDVGANDGAYGAFLQKQFGARVVHAFEPLPQYAGALAARRFVVHPVALSDRAGEADFHLNAYPAASSLLPTTDLCRKEYPQTARSSTCRVRLARLDDELPDPPQDSLVKIDAQGHEIQVIRGGRKVLSAARAILIEMTFMPLYEGQALFNKVHAELDALGFEMRGFLSQFRREGTGDPLFAHCAYVRRD